VFVVSRLNYQVVIGRSNIVGLPVAIMAIHRNATVTMCHSRTADLEAVSEPIKYVDALLTLATNRLARRQMF
jgi:5,10-methylene-tetrahydrofolate dehydrogenase/methenyl tetrahydrofolate cyclohydrolase